MNDKLEKKLVKKYPKILSEYRGNPNHTCMAFGLECGDGWYNIIDFLLNRIQTYIDRNEKPQVVAEQIKEKFGGLRFYYRGGDAHVSGIVSTIEALSYKVCEVCGSMAGVKQSNSGWITTRCKKCMK